MKKNFIIVYAVISLTFVLAACGGGSNQEVAKEPQAITVDFNLSNALAFDPETVSVPTGAEITINLDNSASALEHSWALLPSGADINVAPDELEANAIQNTLLNVQASEKGTLTFSAPASGSYQFVCTVAGHIQGGMKGTLTVTE